MTYNYLISIYNTIYNDGEKLWTYDKTLDHIKVLGGSHEVQIMCYTVETTWEPIQTLGEGDNITVVLCAK